MIDHTNCSHPRTPAGRRACRAAGTATPAPDYVKQAMTKTLTAHKIRARMDREAKAPTLGQPYVMRPATMTDRAYQRLLARTAACPQVELHKPEHGGRCACGWTA